MTIKTRLISVVSWALLFVFFGGCAMNSKPLFLEYDAQGQPLMSKRIPRHIIRDFKVRWSKKAYKRNDGTGPHFLLSTDQRVIKNEYGPPDYISRTYLSRKGNYVKEWVYWEEGELFQFVRRNLIYEGPLTDRERVLILYGFPDDALVYQIGPEIERENFCYNTLFGTTRRTFHFVNGKCIDKNFLY